MTFTTHEIALNALDAIHGLDSLCLFVGEDERPLRGTAGYLDWRLCGRLSRLLQDGFFTGALNDRLLLPAEGRIAIPRIFVLGVGKKTALQPASLSEVMAAAGKMLTRASVQSVALEIPRAPAVDDPARVSALSRAFMPEFKGKVAILAERSFSRVLSSSGMVA